MTCQNVCCKAYGVHMMDREVLLAHSYSEFVSQDAQTQHSTAATGRLSFTRVKGNVGWKKELNDSLLTTP